MLTRHKPIRSLMIATEWHRKEVIEAIRYGTRGLITAPVHDMALLSKAVNCVYRGQVWANSDQLSHTLDQFSSDYDAKQQP